MNNTPLQPNKGKITKQTHVNDDIIEDILESSLPRNFPRITNRNDGNGAQTGPSNSVDSECTEQLTGVTTTTWIEKEGKVDDIWRLLNTLNRIQSQRNHTRAVNKRTIKEIDAFEEKVESWVKDYRDFVDDGVTRKQPLILGVHIKVSIYIEERRGFW